MSIVAQLATSMKRRDELPNIELAKSIAGSGDSKAIAELMQLLLEKNKDIQHDCIKALYETGRIKPRLISGFRKEFPALLKSRNNRLQWGAMTALGTLVAEDLKAMYAALPEIMDAAEKGSVITRDHCMNILTGLYTNRSYSKNIFPLLSEILQSCPDNQLAMYAENLLPVIQDAHKTAFEGIIRKRIPGIEKESAQKRLRKIIGKI